MAAMRTTRDGGTEPGATPGPSARASGPGLPGRPTRRMSARPAGVTRPTRIRGTATSPAATPATAAIQAAASRTAAALVTRTVVTRAAATRAAGPAAPVTAPRATPGTTTGG